MGSYGIVEVTLRAQTRPRGRDLAPTFTLGAVLSSDVAPAVIAEIAVIAVPRTWASPLRCSGYRVLKLPSLSRE